MNIYPNGRIMMAFTLVLLLCGACGSKQTTVKSKPEQVEDNTLSLNDVQLKNAGLQIGEMEQKQVSFVIKVNGKIDVPPQNVVSVSVPLGGYLKSTDLLPGVHVNKGEVIATMEDQQYIQLQQDYLTAKSKLQFAELEYNRQKELNQSQASSDKVTQQAQSEAANQRIILHALAEKLRLIHMNPDQLSAGKISKSIHIYSTITGFVSRVNVNIGKYVNPSDVLFELINPTDIHLNLKIYEKDIPNLFVGQKLVAYSNSQPDKKYACKIILISKDISADGIADVHCHFESYDKALLPGMYMNADIEARNQKNYTLPEDAIVNFEGKDYLFEKLNTHQFAMKEVKCGDREKGFVSITNSGELKGKEIVVKGAYTLLMKLKNKEE